MLWFELSLKNAFELRNKEEHLMGFVSRDRTEFVSHLLTLILYASHLGRMTTICKCYCSSIDYLNSIIVFDLPIQIGSKVNISFSTLYPTLDVTFGFKL